MPTQTIEVEAEIFLEHNGVKVYCTYKNDDIDQGPQTFWFTLDPEYSESNGESFDVRELPTWKEPAHPPFLSLAMPPKEYNDIHGQWNQWHASGVEKAAIIAAIIAAIDQGLLKPPETAKTEP